MNKTLLKSLLLILLVAGFTQAQSTTFDFDDAAASGNIYDGARATGYTFTESGIEFNYSAVDGDDWGLLYYNPGTAIGPLGDTVTGFLYAEAQTKVLPSLVAPTDVFTLAPTTAGEVLSGTFTEPLTLLFGSTKGIWEVIFYMSGGGTQVVTIGKEDRDGGGSLITETDDTEVSVAGSFTHITFNSTSYPTIGHSPSFQLDQMVAVHGTVDEGEDVDFGGRLSYNWNELEDLFVVTMDGDISAAEIETGTGVLTAGVQSIAADDDGGSPDTYNLDFDLSYDIDAGVSATISMDFTQTVLNKDWENGDYKYNKGFYEALDCTFRFTRADLSVVEETYRVVFTMGPRSGSFQQANGDGANNIFLMSRVKDSETAATNTHNENRKIDVQTAQGGADIIFADNDASDTGDLWVMPGVNARIIGSINSETTISFNTGTPKYKSVEIALGEPGEWATATMYDSGAEHSNDTRIGEMYLMNVTGMAAAQQGGNVFYGNSQKNRFYSYNGYGDTSYKHDEFFGMDGDDSMGGDQSVQWVDGGNGNDMYETKWDAVGSAYMRVDFEEDEDKDPGSTDPEIPDGPGWVGVSYHKADGSLDDALSPIDYLINVESITGGRGHPDLMYGNGQANIFLGLAGENVLHGRDGDDTLIVDEDYVSGDNYSNGFSFLEVDGGAGFDKLWLNGDSTPIDFSALTDAGAVVTNIEKIDLSQLWTSYIRDLLIDSSDYTNRWTSDRELSV